MRSFLVVLFLFTTSTTCLNAQSVLLSKLPKVIVTIEIPCDSFSSSDSVKFVMIVSNYSDITQTLLFDKPLNKVFPWGTTITVENSEEKRMGQFWNRELISSQLYTEDQLKKQNMFYELKPGESLNHTYYLNDLQTFDTTKLAKGKYTLQLDYYLNQSNRVTFTIK